MPVWVGARWELPYRGTGSAAPRPWELCLTEAGRQRSATTLATAAAAWAPLPDAGPPPSLPWCRAPPLSTAQTCSSSRRRRPRRAPPCAGCPRRPSADPTLQRQDGSWRKVCGFEPGRWQPCVGLARFVQCRTRCVCPAVHCGCSRHSAQHLLLISAFQLVLE